MSARIHKSNLSFTTIQVSWGLFKNSFFSHLQGEGIFEGKPEFALFGHRALDLKHDFAVFFFPTTPLVDSREDRGGHVGWPWGWFPWTRGWDFMNEALRCEMVEFFRNVDSKFVGAVAGSKGNCFDFFWPS